LLTSGGFFDVSGKEESVPPLELKASNPDFWNDSASARKIMKEISTLKSTVDNWNKINLTWEDLNAHFELAQEANDENELKEIIKGVSKLSNEIETLEIQSKLSGEFDFNNAIVSLHAGAGGTEACDWVDMLLRMYLRWGESKGFKCEITDILPGEEAGIKRVTFIFEGPFAYGLMQSEIGVHRLVRISPFDSNARRHTSFASCDVIPEVDDNIEIDIKDSELRIDTYRAGGHGGQHVNKTDSAVRITHLPTNIVVQCQNERSQLKNKQTAMKMLKARLYDLEQEKKRASREKHYDEKGNIAWGNQIRSYVFMPYQLVKDLRTNCESGDVNSVMDGDIDQFIQAYLKWKSLNRPKTQ